MGMFDTFDVEGCDGQVKVYDRVMDLIKIGDKVHNRNLPSNHSIKLRNGKWVNIVDDVFVSYTETPEQKSLYDKWGREVSTDFSY